MPWCRCRCLSLVRSMDVAVCCACLGVRYWFVFASRRASVVLIVSGSYFDAVVEPYEIVLCVHSTGLERVLWKRLPVVCGKESMLRVTVWVRPEIAVSIVAVLSTLSLLEHRCCCDAVHRTTLAMVHWTSTARHTPI